MKKEFRLQEDGKKIIVNEQDGKFNVIVMSSEKSTDDYGEYIKLNIEELIYLYNSIGAIIKINDKTGMYRHLYE